MKLIVGLGNPGITYINTRHNVGFAAIKKIIGLYDIDMRQDYKSLIGAKDIDGEKILFAMPQTYMNLSGEAVQKISSFYKIIPQDITIIHDDTDIELGKIKLKNNGSSGGHNGIKNIIEKLGCQNFNRIRIGIGRKPAGWQLNDYVLGRFLPAQDELIQQAIEKASAAVNLIITADIFVAMNKFNTKKGV